MRRRVLCGKYMDIQEFGAKDEKNMKKLLKSNPEYIGCTSRY
jgi:hypothetical protein